MAKHSLVLREWLGSNSPIMCFCWAMYPRGGTAASHEDFSDDLASPQFRRSHFSLRGQSSHSADDAGSSSTRLSDWERLLAVCAECAVCTSHHEQVSPTPKLTTTSRVERQHRQVRMVCRRLTRPTNAFSTAHENHIAASPLQWEQSRCHGKPQTGVDNRRLVLSRLPRAHRPPEAP